MNEGVAAEPGGVLDLGSGDRSGQGGVEVEQAGEAGEGAGELAGPVGDVGEGGVGGELQLELGLELQAGSGVEVLLGVQDSGR